MMPEEHEARSEDDFERQRRFVEFIHRSNPSADAYSLLLFGQLLRTSKRLVQRADRNLAIAGLSWAKLRILMSLRRGEKRGLSVGLQPSELSEAEGISRNTVSALIAGLEQAGMVNRELHGTDKRRFLIRLTAKGRGVVDAKLKDEVGFVTGCFTVFSPQEKREMIKWLRRLGKNLDAQVDQGQRSDRSSIE